MAVSKSLVKKLLQKHMPKLGDGYSDFEFTSIPSQDYDATTGNSSDSIAPTVFDIKALEADFAFKITQSSFLENDNTVVLDKDKKIVSEVRFFDDKSVVPKKDDTVLNKETNIKYNVVGGNKDPYNGIYLLHIRPIEE